MYPDYIYCTYPLMVDILEVLEVLGLSYILLF
jgi:hypothetical protein